MTRPLLLLVILVTVFFSGCDSTESPAGYDTPEKAVEGYTAAIINKDYQAALRFYPAEQLEKGFDKTAYEIRYQTKSMYPDFEKSKSDFAFKTGYLAASFLLEEITLDPDTEINAEWFEQFFKGTDIDK